MELSKQLGTRHRAGVGISEVSDSLTIIVSEETGQVSVAQNGELSRGLTSAELRFALIKAQNKKNGPAFQTGSEVDRRLRLLLFLSAHLGEEFSMSELAERLIGNPKNDDEL